jgi:hypothetical protein
VNRLKAGIAFGPENSFGISGQQHVFSFIYL